MKNLRILILIALVPLLAVTVACTEKNVTNNPPPTGPEPPQSVTAAASFSVLPTAIQCHAKSTCSDAGGSEIGCSRHEWDIFLGELLVASKTGVLVQFDELAPGDYKIEITTYAPDGQSDSKTYNRTVTGAV